MVKRNLTLLRLSDEADWARAYFQILHVLLVVGEILDVWEQNLLLGR
jgi:hypothetical protein